MTGLQSPRSAAHVSGARKRALVVGGTGPTGPDVVSGLRDRGFETTIFHGGRHEVDLPDDVAHIHGDPHFKDTIAEALGSQEYDVVVAQYGRLRYLVDHFRHRTEHLVAIGGFMGPLAPTEDPRWGPLGRPAVVREDARHYVRSAVPDKLAYRISEAQAALFKAQDEGAFSATYIGYPTLYGPRQPGATEWSIVRRLRDGRRRIILPHGGLRIESRGFNGNVALAPLLAIDHREVADGRSYLVADADIYTTMQRVQFIAHHLGVEVDVVDMPYSMATPAHPFYRRGPSHVAGTSDAVRSELGYTDRFDAHEALARTVDWLLSPEADIGGVERQLRDPFDYEHEDRLIAWWEQVRADAPPPVEEFSYRHMYRHPTSRTPSKTEHHTEDLAKASKEQP